MAIVVNIDQRESRKRGLGPTVRLVAELEADAAVHTLLDFRQVAGDEVQGAVADTASLVSVIARAAGLGNWWIGIGLGRVEVHGTSVSQSTGEAFFHARDALARAKRAPWGLAVGSVGEWSTELERALALWVALLSRRTRGGWEVVRLAEEGHSTEAIASTLSLTPQAVTNRLRVAEWRLDREARELLTHIGGLALAEVTPPP